MQRAFPFISTVSTVVISPETNDEVATFAKPNRYPVGIEHFLANGIVAVEKGELMRALAGKIMKLWE